MNAEVGQSSDVLIVGGGPSGLALAAAVVQQGLSVRVVAPHAPRPPQPTYGAWWDELPEWVQACAAQVWTDVRVYTTPQPTPLLRPYALLDNDVLLDALLTRAAPGLCWTQGTVTGVEERPQPDAPLTVRGTAGERWTAGVVVDAAGHAGSLTRPQHPGGAALQTAYGLVGRFRQPPSAPGAMVWMDYRAPHLPLNARREAPTFLYAMHLGGDRYFVEETSLVARPGLTRAELERRLLARLEAQGTPPTEIESTEWVAFPMNVQAPQSGPVLAYGAAGGGVHPVSGFQVAGALADAPVVARAIAAAWPDGRAATQAAWDVLWSAERRAARALALMGVEALLRLPGDRLPDFFRTFFALPATDWHPFLAHRTPTAALARTMLRVFAGAPMAVRGPLVAAALAQPGVSAHSLAQVARSSRMNGALSQLTSGLHARAPHSGMTTERSHEDTDQNAVIEDGMQGATGNADANGLSPDASERQDKLDELRENLADVTHEEPQRLKEAQADLASE